ncbi:YraN family protein [Arcanobacterium hippocoleae]
MKLSAKELKQISTCSKRELGAWGEAKASEYLESLGFQVLARNWRCRFGEVDLVVFDPQIRAVIAVEVKTRRSVQAGIPEEAITPEKLRRIRMLIVEWISVYQEKCRGLHWNELKVQAIAIDIRGEHCFLRYLREL